MAEINVLGVAVATKKWGGVPSSTDNGEIVLAHCLQSLSLTITYSSSTELAEKRQSHLKLGRGLSCRLGGGGGVLPICSSEWGGGGGGLKPLLPPYAAARVYMYCFNVHNYCPYVMYILSHIMYVFSNA